MRGPEPISDGFVSSADHAGRTRGLKALVVPLLATLIRSLTRSCGRGEGAGVGTLLLLRQRWLLGKSVCRCEALQMRRRGCAAMRRESVPSNDARGARKHECRGRVRCLSVGRVGHRRSVRPASAARLRYRAEMRARAKEKRAEGRARTRPASCLGPRTHARAHPAARAPRVRVTDSLPGSPDTAKSLAAAVRRPRRAKPWHTTARARVRRQPDRRRPAASGREHARAPKHARPKEARNDSENNTNSGRLWRREQHNFTRCGRVAC